MALKTAAFLLTLNILFFSLVTSQAPPPPAGTCPTNAIKFGACAGLLNNLLGFSVGTPPTLPCCSLFLGLANLEAATCLCTAYKANVLGVNFEVTPTGLGLLLNNCGKDVPTGFEC